MTRPPDPIVVGYAQRDARRLTRACREYRRFARRIAQLPEEATVARIAGEPVIGDLGERGIAQVGLLMQQQRVVLAIELLAEGLRMVNGEERPWAS